MECEEAPDENEFESEVSIGRRTLLLRSFVIQSRPLEDYSFFVTYSLDELRRGATP